VAVPGWQRILHSVDILIDVTSSATCCIHPYHPNILISSPLKSQRGDGLQQPNAVLPCAGMQW
jgi:hypothetical protein